MFKVLEERYVLCGFDMSALLCLRLDSASVSVGCPERVLVLVVQHDVAIFLDPYLVGAFALATCASLPEGIVSAIDDLEIAIFLEDSFVWPGAFAVSLSSPLDIAWLLVKGKVAVGLHEQVEHVVLGLDTLVLVKSDVGCTPAFVRNHSLTFKINN